MAKECGMIVKIEGRSCIAVTPAGEFKEVPLPQNGHIRIGQEISLAGRKNWRPYLRYLMVAASLLIVFMAGQIYLDCTLQAVAYLTIDINPSIELAIAKDGKVVSGSGLNSDGDKILSEVLVKGCDLEQAVGLIVTQAIADNYLTAGGSNIILSTLTVNEDSDPLVDIEHVYNAIKTSMDSGSVESEVIIESVEPELRQEAQASGISTGKLLLHKKTVEKSLPVSLSEISAMRLDNIEKEKKVSIAKLIGEGSGDLRKYNQGKKEEPGIVKQGLYAERNNNVIIKTRPQRGQVNEKGSDKDNKDNKDNKQNKNDKDNKDNNQYKRDSDNSQNSRDSDNSQNSRDSNSNQYKRDYDSNQNRRDYDSNQYKNDSDNSQNSRDHNSSSRHNYSKYSGSR
ncbi:MAG: anti-sigma factor domain-containing protein [Desulfotomaculaceae bacterium]|nr:anti-sigma factor domain-containing protein [Desulfotomaculaceae bacterium]